MNYQTMLTAIKLLAVALGGFASLMIMFMHPIGPAIVLLAISPFDAIPNALLGIAGNAITLPPIIAFLFLTRGTSARQVFLGTPVQVAAFVYVILLFLPHGVGAFSIGYPVLVSYLRKLTLIVLLAIFAWSMRTGEHVTLCVKVLVISMSLYIAMSMLQFYLGIHILPDQEPSSLAVAGMQFEAMLGNDFRFSAVGISVNRTAAWLLVPAILSIGLLNAESAKISRPLAAVAFVVLILGLIGTISRSGLVSAAIGSLVLAMSVSRARRGSLVVLLGMGAIALGTAWLLLGETGVGDAIAYRLDDHEVSRGASGRYARWNDGLWMFLRSPLFGVGVGNYADHASVLVRASGGASAHSAYVNLLAESGLMGFLPYMVLLAVVARALVKPNAQLPAGLLYWRPYFLASLAAASVINLFNDYSSERLLWLPIAYAAALGQASALLRSGQTQKTPVFSEYVGFDRTPRAAGMPEWTSR